MASTPHSLTERLVAWSVALTSLVAACSSPRNRFCTPVPDLYSDWARTSHTTDSSASAIRSLIESRRPQVESLPDVFTRLWSKSTAELTEEEETIVWRDDSVMVLAPRRAGMPELVVVPRKAASFLIDASPKVIAELATVAAASSDALALAAGRRCDQAAHSEIHVNPADALPVRQLYVRVRPSPPLRVSNVITFYTRVAQVLQEKLGKGTTSPRV